ncbi:MAG: HTH domain-containing protein [Candidatus Paceibacterota bacterium]|jgi:DNA-binding transcriptional ArsR family regulator/anti-anti-sigma regulatory factor|nr:HTH domain-containing protein [Candidatus Paceibacterota bacterium]MDD5555432.1 HTH domain-containing protein [Candidatus Paceibacterota bacterium]
MKTSEKIIKYIGKKGQTSGAELSDYLEITDRAVRKQLKFLVENEVLKKEGRPPKVFYSLKEKKRAEEKYLISEETVLVVENRFLAITSAGEEKRGLKGFIYWCKKNNLPIEKTAREYIKTLEKYDKYKKDGYIDGTDKFLKTFKDVFIDKVFYLDFYSIERLGKTRLGQLLLYAKTSQNKKMIKWLVAEIKPKIEKLIKKFNIDGVGFIPPTVKREVQLMKEIEKNLKLKTRIIKISKIKTDVIVPQKTLSKVEDRIENAQKTIAVEEGAVFSNILLIDDAVGSGATLNETARKIRQKKICKNKIIGLAITGSFKGFDVISEV